MNRFHAGLKKHTGHLLLVLSALLLVALLFCSPGLVPTAHAASTSARVSVQPNTSSYCSSPGSLIESDNIYGDGELDVYYNSSTGYNCAYVRSTGSTWGVSKEMIVEIWSCAQTSPSSSCTATSYDEDGGNYSYYAGPVAVRAPGHCISFDGMVRWDGYNEWYESSPVATHCG